MSVKINEKRLNEVYYLVVKVSTIVSFECQRVEGGNRWISRFSILSEEIRRIIERRIKEFEQLRVIEELKSNTIQFVRVL